MNKYSELLKPFKIGNMEVKNRVVMAPMGTNNGRNDGRIEEAAFDFYAERAKGGVGLIFTGNQLVFTDEETYTRESRLVSDYVIPTLATLCRSVKRYGARIGVQLGTDVGRIGAPKKNGEILSSSALPAFNFPDIICRPLTHEEIQEYVECYRNAASIARRAGFDIIEINAHAGYLFDQFMSSCWNTREDEYGGSLENRMRFSLEVIRAIKEENGEDYPVSFRMSLRHMFEGGRSLEEGLEIIKVLQENGIDMINLDIGSYENIDFLFTSIYVGNTSKYLDLEKLKEVATVPILLAGNDLDTALNLVEKGYTTAAIFGRQLIAEPHLVKKLQNEQVDEIRPCIRCNEGCVARIFTLSGKAGCSLNANAFDEAHFKVIPAEEKKHVVVIGGGPAGMETARVASLRGHKVSLYEKNSFLGGQMAAAATPSFKSSLKDLIRWYELQLKKLGVAVYLENEVTDDTPELASCDYIVIATGAESIVPPIPGIHGDNVVDIMQAHLNEKLVEGDDIVICGGGLSGCDYALELAMDQKKKNVTIVEMKDEVAKDMFFVNKVSLMDKLREYNINLEVSAKVVSIDENGVTVIKDGAEKVIKADTVVTAFGMKPSLDKVRSIKEKYHLKTRVIGDCDKVAKIGEAVTDGFFVGISID